MNKLILSIIVPGFISVVFAQTVVTPVMQTQRWVSKNSGDNVTIENGNGNNLTITINVDKVISTDQGPRPAGINISNCGDTRHVDSGSSVVCVTKDSANPVTFSSDSSVNSVSGTYSIR